MRVVKHECGSVTAKLLQFDKPSGNSVPTSVANALSSTSGSAKNVKKHVVETVIRILSRLPSCGVFISRLRIEFFKETGEMIPIKRMGFLSERHLFASMPENFNLRPTTAEPGLEPQYIVSLASVASKGTAEKVNDGQCIDCINLQK